MLFARVTAIVSVSAKYLEHSGFSVFTDYMNEQRGEAGRELVEVIWLQAREPTSSEFKQTGILA